MLGVYAIVTSAVYGWGSVHTLGFGGGALVLLAIFVWLESRVDNPIPPLRILGIRSLSGASAVRGLLIVGMFTTFFIGALYLQHVRGYDAIATGLAFLPHTLVRGGLSLGVTARLMRRFGPQRLVAFGLVMVIAALVLMAGAGQHEGYFPRLFVAYALFGIGAGTAFMPLTILAMADVPAVYSGLAAGIGNVSMQVSAAIGLAAIGTISADHTRALAAQGQSLANALTGGYQLAFSIAAVCVAVALLVV